MIQIRDKHACCGCTACASICGRNAIEMKPDEEGFLYPVCDLSLCVNCHLCEQVCPVIARDRLRPDIEPGTVLAARNIDENVQLQSSSGGVFTAVAEYVLSRKGVVYGAEYDEHWVVCHRREETMEGALRLRGSKYVQSNLKGVYEDIRFLLRQGRLVLFSGTPCQVEGLKCFLRSPFDNLLTVDILCHGVPSPMIFADYVRFIKKYSIGNLQGIFMKDKTFGWGYQNLRLTFSNGTSQFNTSLSNLWNRIFYSRLAFRPACYACRYTNYHRPGDITIGDFWGVEKSLPDFVDRKGISLILINNLKGKIIWSNIEAHFKYLKSSKEHCLQQCLSQPVLEPENRLVFWKDYATYGFPKIARTYYDVSYKALFKGFLYQFVSLIRYK